MGQVRVLRITASTLLAAAMVPACDGGGTNAGESHASNIGGKTSTTSASAGENSSGGSATFGGSGAGAGGDTANESAGRTSVLAGGAGAGGSAVGSSSGQSAGTAGVLAQERRFLMGSTPFFATASAFPDWRFENLEDRDLLSLHVDDFLGIPWDQCSQKGCVNLPTQWVAKWQTLADQARASNKPIYLSVSPLGDRKTLARRVLSDGTTEDHWLASTVIDSNGCYLFGSDPNADKYGVAYVAFLNYLVELIHPTYLSPGIEINIPFTACAGQKNAWVTWYNTAHQAIKAAHPSLVVFPTFQLEHLYGVASSEVACGNGLSYDQCFTQRLADAIAILGDRIAFSSYPIAWKFAAAAGFRYPTDTYSRVKAATTRRIWISETGWSAVPIRNSYAHGSAGSCGDFRVPASFVAPGGATVGLANDTEHAAYVAWLLNEAQREGFEAVVWWLNRDYLDGTVATTCPCDPATSDTCALSNLFYAVGADDGDFALRVFANMGLRRYDGSARPGFSPWKDFLGRRYQQR